MSTPATIRLREPAEVISIVPYLLGFTPQDSAVVLALHQARIIAAARLDLPIIGGDDQPFTDAIHYLAARLAVDVIDAAVVVGYGPAEPVAHAVGITTAALTDTGVKVRNVLRVHEGRWWNLRCTDPECCPAQGTPFDPSTSVAAATATAAGLVALPDRHAVAQQLTPIIGPARDAFAAATAAAVNRLLTRADRATAPAADGADISSDDAWLATPQGLATIKAGQEAITEAMNTYRRAQTLDDQDAATLTVLLGIPEVRDTAVRLSTGDDWQIRMWTDLVRRAEPDFTTGPAVVLAIVALQAGNGVLADCAVHRALDADPTNQLAHLVVTLVQTGIDPASMAALVARC